jgi:hypothetical protein
MAGTVSDIGSSPTTTNSVLAASLVACIHRLRLPILQDYQAI